MLLLLFTSCILLSVGVDAHKVLLINDIHLDIDSTAKYSEPGTPLNHLTLDKVLSEAADIESKTGEAPEAILLMGDMCKHGLAVEIDSETNNWDIMKKTMREAIRVIVENFPSVPILPVLGNNDVVYHDQAPGSNFKDEFYGQLWEIMFEEVAANAHIAANETIKATWMEGGYYVYEIDHETMVIALNGMYPFFENFEDKDMAWQMIDWVEATLDANPDKHFITETHVFFGNNWYHNLEQLWNLTYTDKMMEILHKHQDRLIVSLGAHIHHVQVMAPKSVAVEDLNIVQVISPAISPIYMNNPGYGVFHFSAKNGIEKLIFQFFQLEDFSRLGVVDFAEYDIMRYTGMDLNDANSVRDYLEGLYYNMQAYAGYISRNMGLRDFMAQGS